MVKTKIVQFQQTVWEFYKKNKRSLPWRKTADPFKILVSEIMLQQTQVDRVIPKYQSFLKRFPNPTVLSRANLAHVLQEWQGLGYNRRALYLKKAADTIMKNFHGKIPADITALQTLPGVGYNTACAILAYAFNQPVTFIETNIRSVFIHHFFAKTHEVSDKQIMPLVEKSVDQATPREWYWALMDYGSFLKKTNINPSRSSKHYTKQSRFIGSTRQIRGLIIRFLLTHPEKTAADIINVIKHQQQDHMENAAKITQQIIMDLQKEKMISKNGTKYSIAQHVEEAE